MIEARVARVSRVRGLLKLSLLTKIENSNDYDVALFVKSHIAPKYLGNIVEIFLGNIVRLLKYFETYHLYC